MHHAPSGGRDHVRAWLSPQSGWEPVLRGCPAWEKWWISPVKPAHHTGSHCRTEHAQSPAPINARTTTELSWPRAVPPVRPPGVLLNFTIVVGWTSPWRSVLPSSAHSDHCATGVGWIGLQTFTIMCSPPVHVNCVNSATQCVTNVAIKHARTHQHLGGCRDRAPPRETAAPATQASAALRPTPLGRCPGTSPRSRSCQAPDPCSANAATARSHPYGPRWRSLLSGGTQPSKR
jgi:hypothetical protein